MAFVVPARFCGPPESGNGGWVSGHLAAPVRPGPDAAAVTVRLRTPPPLDRELEVAGRGRRSAALEVADGEHLVARRRRRRGPGPAAYRPVCRSRSPRRPASAYEGLADHPFPTCFSCGTGRDAGDGLRLRPGPGRRRRRGVCRGVGARARRGPRDGVGGAGLPGRLGLGHRRAADGARHDDRPGRRPARRRRAARRHGLAARRARAASTTAARPCMPRTARLLAQAEATWIAIDPTTVRPAGPADHDQLRAGPT